MESDAALLRDDIVDLESIKNSGNKRLRKI